MRLILEAWSFSQSRSSSPCSTLNFLLLGLMGGGPVRWLVRADATGRVCILGSPLRAASPTQREMMSSPRRRNAPLSAPLPCPPLAKLLPVESFGNRTGCLPFSEHGLSARWAAKHTTFYTSVVFYTITHSPPPALLRFNWRSALCNVKVHKVLIWYTYMLLTPPSRHIIPMSSTTL